MTALLQQFQAVSGLEALALLTGIGYAVLAVRHSRWCWVSGAVSSALLAWLAARQQLPMQAIMQASYVAFSIYGFWSWTRSATSAASPRITTWPTRRHLLSLMSIAVACLLAAPWLARYTQAAWPRLDTAIMLASYLATWMTAASKLENWAYWIVIDLSSVLLYGAQGLQLAAVLYVVYAGIAIFGLRSWWLRWRSAPA
jgi:nicotinamide mononucleotide transporter